MSVKPLVFDDDGCRHRDQNRLSQFPRDGHHRILKNGGKLEIAQQMADHESARTIGLYDQRNDQLTLDEVERIVI